MFVPDAPTTRLTKVVPGNPTEGNHVTLTCEITDGRPRNDIKNVIWHKELKTFSSSSRYTLSDKNKVLKITSLSHTKDDGNYSCAATNEAGMGDFSATFQLQINCKCNFHNRFQIA